MRKFFENIVDYPYAIILIIAFLCVFGIYILQNRIPVEREPDITVPYVMLHLEYPGASPSDVEQKITRKIEEKLTSLENVDNYQSISYDGGLEIVVKFLSNEEIKEAKREVEDIFNLVKAEFPEDAEEAVIETRSYDDTPVLLVNIVNADGVEDFEVLNKYAEMLKTDLESADDVAYVEIFGKPEKEIRIDVNPLLAKANGLTVKDIAGMIQQAHQNLPVGEIVSDKHSMIVKTIGEFSDSRDIESLKLKLPDGREILLIKVAKVSDTFADRKSYSRYNGKPCLTLIVKGKDKINVLDAVNVLQARVADFKENAPTSIGIHTSQDKGSDVKLMINQLGSSAVYGAIFVLILLVIMIGLRNAVLVGFAIPFTILFGITFLYIFDMSINTITIFAMIVIMGLVVDGAIIVSENIFRHIEEGKSPKSAAKRGISEVGPSVLVADITTICAFLPIAFMSGMTGDYLRYLPITVILTLIGSMIIDHFGMPVIIPRLTLRIFNKRRVLQTFMDLPGKFTQKFQLRKDDQADTEDDFHKADTKRIEKQMFNTPEPDVTVDDLAMTFSEERVANKFPELGEFYDEKELKEAIVKRYYDKKTTRRILKVESKTNVDDTADVPKTSIDKPEAKSVKVFQNVRRWKLDFKGILDASEDLNAILLEQLEKSSDFAPEIAEVETGDELVDSFVQAIKDAKKEHDAGLVTSFWRKGEAPEVREESDEKKEEERIVIPPSIDFRDEPEAESEIPVYKKDRTKADHDTAKLERDLLTERAAFIVRFIRAKYGSILNVLIKFRFFIFAVVLIAAGVALFTVLSGNIGIEYIPHIDRSRFYIRIKMPVGTSLKHTSETIRKIEQVLNDYSQSFRNIGRESYIESYTTTIGDTNALLVDLREYAESGDEVGKIQVELIDIERRTLTQYEVIQELRKRMPVLPDAEIVVDEVFEGPPTGADISVKLTGNDLKTLQESADRLKRLMQHVEGTEDVSSDFQLTKPKLEIVIKREMADKLGVNPAELSLLLRSSIYGYESGEILRGDDEIKIVTMLENADDTNFQSIEQMPVKTNSGKIITLSEVADFSFTSIPKGIRHYDGKRSITVRSNLAPGFNAKETEQRIIEEIQADDSLSSLIPDQVSYAFVGETKERDESFEELTISMFVGVMLILFVLFIYFNSMRITFIIIMAIPLGFAGAVFGLYISDNTFNLMSFIGIVALMGIVVNDAIVLVDCIKDNRKKGYSLRNSVIRAGQIRLRPVILTSATTILGLIPLTLNFAGGGYFWQPLCIAIIFGILFATLLTLIVIPLAYFELYRRDSRKQIG